MHPPHKYKEILYQINEKVYGRYVEEEDWELVEENELLNWAESMSNYIEKGEDSDGYIEKNIQLGKE